MNESKPTILTTEIAAKTNIFCIERLKIRFNNGNECEFERLKSCRNRAVMILPIQDENILMIREYAAGLDCYEFGLPKGLMESGESIEIAADRELKEEIGYGSKKIHHLKTLSISPQYMDYQIHVVIAQDLYPEKLEGDEPEPIEVIPYPIKKIDELMLKSSFSEARTISALFLLKQWLAKNDQ